MALHGTRRLASALVATLALAMTAEASAGQKLYTAHNLWFEHPQKVASTGFNKGTLLPAGTEVTDVEADGKSIEFTVVSTKAEMRMIFFAKHHPGLTAKVFADRLFTAKDFAALTAGMTAEEIEAIRAGRIGAGMSRAAVLVARGYPPESKTSTLEAEVWNYQNNRFASEDVRFKDGKVTIEAPPPPPPWRAGAEEEARPDPKYLQYNLWFENPEKLYSANFQTGTLLPAGTEIQAIAVLSDSIAFTVVATKVDYEIEFNPKHHPGLPIEKLAERMIGSKDFSAVTQGFSADEVSAIRAGEIRPGMSRAAVLVAAGFPPESKTATLNASSWTYFSSRYKSYAVDFQGDKVSAVRK